MRSGNYNPPKSDPVTLLVFSAGSTQSHAERLVTEARHAITADVIARVRALALVERIVVATDSHALAETLREQACLAIDMGGAGAEPLLERARRIFTDAYGQADPQVSGCTVLLGQSRQAGG